MFKSITAASLFALSLSTVVSAQDNNVAEVKKAFDDAHIPTDLHITFNPTRALLHVTLPQETGPAITLHAGIQLPRNSTAGPPIYSISTLSGIGLGRGPFVLAAVDPDAPTPQTPTSAQIRHFLGGNFFLDEGTGKELKNATPAISQYRQPTPPAGSDAHRYIFLLYKQPAGFNTQTVVNSTTSPALFNISQFAETVGLGDPLAGSFMLVAPNPPVPA